MEADIVVDSHSERSLNVLWVIPTIDASFGGPSTTTVNSVLAEAQSGINVTLAFTATAQGKEELRSTLEELRMNGVELQIFSRASGRKWAGAWGISLGIFRWLLKNVRRYDVVNIQYIWAATSLLASIAARFAATPSILTPHESLTAYDIDITSGSYLKRIAKLVLREVVLRSVNVVQFNSALEESDSEVRGSPRVVTNSFPVVEKAGEARPVRNSPAETFEVGFIGRLHPKKNVGVCIRAMGSVDEHFRLQVAGRGEAEDEYRMLDLVNELEVQERVTWHGHVPRHERTRFFSGIDVLAMPSTYESFGMVAAEAMAEGVPVISTPSAGVADVIREFRAGIILSDISPTDLAAALRCVQRDPELLSRMSNGGVQAARTHFTFSSYAHNMHTLYREMARGE